MTDATPQDPAAVAAPIGVSCVVRTKRDVLTGKHPEGSIGLVVGQARNGPSRYSVIFPGDPFAWSLAAKDLDVLREVDPQSWWKKPAAPPAADEGGPERSDPEEAVELAARAIWHADAMRYFDCPIEGWAEVAEPQREEFRLWARAAISALHRETE